MRLLQFLKTMWNSYYLKENCGVCGSSKNVVKHTTEKQNNDYIPLVYCLHMEQNILSHRFSEELSARYIKKNMCARCRTSIVAFSKSAINRIHDVADDAELDIVASQWISTRLASISKSRHKGEKC